MSKNNKSIIKDTQPPVELLPVAQPPVELLPVAQPPVELLPVAQPPVELLVDQPPVELSPVEDPELSKSERIKIAAQKYLDSIQKAADDRTQKVEEEDAD